MKWLGRQNGAGGVGIRLKGDQWVDGVGVSVKGSRANLCDTLKLSPESGAVCGCRLSVSDSTLDPWYSCHVAVNI